MERTGRSAADGAGRSDRVAAAGSIGSGRVLRSSRRDVLRAGAAAALAGAGAAASTGTASAETVPRPTRNRSEIRFEQFVGVNAFVDDPIEDVRAVAGTVREYHNWYWDEGDGSDYPEYPDNELKFTPSYAGGGAWDFDEFYHDLGSEPLDTWSPEDAVYVSPCVQNAPLWLQDAEDFERTHVPTDEADADPTDPQSYEAKAHHAFQFAARYGRTSVDLDRLTLAPDQEWGSGFSLLGYFEDWNEPNRWWDGGDAEFSPAEYAAMSSAAYDGHGGTLEGPTGTYGVKNADPETQYVMGGTAGIDLEWIQALDDWYSEHRPDGEFVPDVLNVHHYCHSDGDSGPALSPEEDDLRGRMEELTSWRDEHYPGVEVWLSEFGWDTHPESVVRPPEVPGFTREQVQGQFLVRAFLELAAAGVDRAHAYLFRDVDPEDSTQYSTSGLVTQKGEWEPKPAWYYVSTLREALRGYGFDAEVPTEPDDVRAYRFFLDDDTGYDRGVALWSPTTEGRTVEGVELDVAADLGERDSVDGARLVELVDGEPAGRTSDLAVEDGRVTVDVGETPAIVQVSLIESTDCGPHGDEPAVSVNSRTVCDVNGDGYYGDVNADAELTHADVQEFFAVQHRPSWKQPEYFDFNGNGDVGHGDVVALFEDVAAQSL